MTSATFAVAQQNAGYQMRRPEYDPEYGEFEATFMKSALSSGVITRLMMHVVSVLPSSPERWWIARKATRLRRVNENARSLARSVRALFE